jgi:hypothetical protein
MWEKIENAFEDYSVGIAILLSIGIVIGWLALTFGLLCLRALIVMLLWNATVTVLLGFPMIGFWMSMDICLLTNGLFKGYFKISWKTGD